MRRLHSVDRWLTAPILPHEDERSRIARHHHHRKPGEEWKIAPRPGSLPKRRRDAMRLLHLRNDHDRGRPSATHAESDRERYRSRDGWECLPLRNVSANRCGRETRRQTNEGSRAMKNFAEPDVI